jgi:hypothetical protein
MHLIWFPHFMQILNSIRKHPTKNECFPKHILLTTIYLLQEQILNHRKYFEQEINMRRFCTIHWAWCENVCKLWRFNFLWIVVIKYSKLWFIVIFYNAIMHKIEFGQVYCLDLLDRIIRKFIFNFFIFILFSMYFRNLNKFLEILHWKTYSGKR